ncbi:tubby C-terminal domain-like protein [Kurthia huakuii]|uniref:tubby C-terminal domain-like protein n=1 Tax=Kurthia huakuii TaxID=1421019 RepID=UPI000496669C|nr:hypothetical protein [Kurthia huakuii]MBM7698144.1 hypothetical protein [Kurthia huakuii]
MKQYLYTHPNTMIETPEIFVKNTDAQNVGTVQRIYGNGLTRFLDRAMDYKYFVKYEAHIQDYDRAMCRKISRKGRVFYRAEIAGEHPFEIGYIGWRDLIPDLQITNGETTMILHKEHEGWSVFEWQETEYARWQAVFNEDSDDFTVELQIEAIAPIQNPAFYLAIAQTTLFIGG